jgi:hypothetical protein
MDLRIALPTAALLVLLVAPMTRAQCVGDCRGDGEVTIDELLILVNIALDNSSLADCESGDTNADGMITVNEIIAAVNKALTGCIPDVTGLWQQDQAAIASSTCAAAVTGIVQQNIAAGDFNCTYQLEQSGEHVTITAMCGGDMIVTDGTVDASGLLSVSTSEQETMDSCSFTLTQNTSGVLTASPTVGTHVLQFQFAPNCGFADCSVTVPVRWTKLSS